MLTAIIIALVLIDLIIFTNGKHLFSFWFTLASIIGLAYFGAQLSWSEMFAVVFSQQTLAFIGIYLISGLCVGMSRWTLQTYRTSCKLEEYKNRFQLDLTTYDGRSSLLEHARRESSSIYGFNRFISEKKAETMESFLEELAPSPREYTSDFTAWATLWPLTLLEIMFKHVLQNFYTFFTGTFERQLSKLTRAIISRPFK